MMIQSSLMIWCQSEFQLAPHDIEIYQTRSVQNTNKDWNVNTIAFIAKTTPFLHKSTNIGYSSSRIAAEHGECAKNSQCMPMK